MAEIVQVQTEEQLQAVRAMFQEYHSELPQQIRTPAFIRKLKVCLGNMLRPTALCCWRRLQVSPPDAWGFVRFRAMREHAK